MNRNHKPESERESKSTGNERAPWNFKACPRDLAMLQSHTSWVSSDQHISREPRSQIHEPVGHSHLNRHSAVARVSRDWAEGDGGAFQYILRRHFLFSWVLGFLPGRQTFHFPFLIPFNMESYHQVPSTTGDKAYVQPSPLGLACALLKHTVFRRLDSILQAVLV